MKIIKPCPHCNETGQIEIVVCDECGDYNQVCVYIGEHNKINLCFKCWSNNLNKEEINNL